MGGYRIWHDLILGMREHIYVGARPVAELLQQIHMPLPMLKTMGLRVSTADPEAVEMVLEELLLFVAGGAGGGGEEQEEVGGKCPSLEKLVLDLEDAPLEASDGRCGAAGEGGDAPSDAEGGASAVGP